MALRSINNFLTALSVGLANTDTEMGIPNAMAQWLQDAVFDATDTVRLTIEAGTKREVVEATAQTQDGVSSGIASVAITRAVEDVSAATAMAQTFDANTKVEHRLTAEDVQDNLRGGGGAAPTVLYDNTGPGTVSVTLANGVVTEIFCDASGTTTYDLQCALVANAWYAAEIFVGKYGPGGTADVDINGGLDSFNCVMNAAAAPVGWPGGHISFRAIVDPTGSSFLHIFKQYHKV